MISFEYILLGVGVLLLVSILISKASGRLGVPALLLFLGVGMLAGSEGPGGIPFEDDYVAQSVGVVALVLILYAGGLETRWEDVRAVLGKAAALSTLGVFLTALTIGLLAAWVLGFSLLEGLLLGAIVSSTDAAAVFSVLRARSVGLRGEIRPLLEVESGSNDPMAVFLTVGLTGVLSDPDSSLLGLVPSFFQQMVVGALLGLGLGRATVVVINRIRLEYDGLYPVLSLALVVLTYSLAAALGGNGFLAVYLAGLVVGHNDFIHKQSLVRFHDGLAWLMQIAMFLVLGLLVFPSRLVPVFWAGLVLSLALMLVARPLGVFATLAFTRMGWREKAMVSWVGLRGAVPIILATFPLLAGLAQAETIFNLVFFIVLTSVLLQGTTLPWVARRLGVDAPLPPRRQYPLEFVQTSGFKNAKEMVEIPLEDDSPAAGRRVVDLRLPKEALILLVARGDEFVVPHGGTRLEAGDRLLVLADKQARAAVREIVGSIHRTVSGEGLSALRPSATGAAGGEVPNEEAGLPKPPAVEGGRHSRDDEGGQGA
ncbi:MAG TPA: potassium/proton antiporter [Pyrinomonadaceae bacterium]|nr:potassium/proton antiporter [Pyrinomonadaceae bacterium]